MTLTQDTLSIIEHYEFGDTFDVHSQTWSHVRSTGEIMADMRATLRLSDGQSYRQAMLLEQEYRDALKRETVVTPRRSFVGRLIGR